MFAKISLYRNINGRHKKNNITAYGKLKMEVLGTNFVDKKQPSDTLILIQREDQYFSKLKDV